MEFIMKMTRILTPLAIAVSAAAFSAAASAGESGYPLAAQPAGAPAVFGAGTTIVRIGASHVNPDEDSTELNFAGVFLPDFENSEYRLDSDTTWNFSAAFFLVDHFAVEFMYIGESDHKVDVRRFQGFADGSHLRLGTLEQQSANLFLNWYPMGVTCLGQPYVGVGVNYSDFDNDSLSVTANDYFADTMGAIGPGTLQVEDSMSWAAQIGIDFMFGRDSAWLVNAAVQYMNVDTSTDVNFPVNGAIKGLRAGLDVDPWVYNLGIGYKF
jgi:outer membrane protein W